MLHATTHHDGPSTGWWTPQRIRVAGLAAIVGALLLFVRFAYGTIQEILGITPSWEIVGSLGYYMSEGLLFVAWAAIFAGFAALYVRLTGIGSRLLTAGTALITLGLGLITVGFGLATVAPAVGAVGLVEPANMIIGISLMIFVTLGMILMGVGLLRTKVGSRLMAALLIVALPATLFAGPLGRALGFGPLSTLVATVPLVAAIILVGHYLRTETPDSVPLPPVTANA